MSNIPEPWATRFIERGFTDRRSPSSQTPSYGALADKVGVNTTTISEAVTGKRKPTAETVAILLRELGSDVAGWLGLEHYGEWDPPAASVLLTPRQRKALEVLIRSIVEEEAGEVRELRTAATKTPDKGPADQPLANARKGGLGNRTVTKLSDRGSKVQDPEPRVAKKRTPKKRTD